MTPTRRALCCRVFSIAFCDRVDHANVLGEVSWSLIKGQFRQRTRQENPITAWIAVLNEVQTPAQLAAAQEARERIDVADRFVLNANGTCLQDLNDAQLRAAIDLHCARVTLQEEQLFLNKLVVLDDSQLTQLLEALFPNAQPGVAARAGGGWRLQTAMINSGRWTQPQTAVGSLRSPSISRAEKDLGKLEGKLKGQAMGRCMDIVKVRYRQVNTFDVAEN